MIWSIAWKNVWRSRKRSLIVICAVTLGTIAGVFTSGMMNGWVNQRIDAVINTEISHIQVHHPDYLLNNELKYTIPDYQKVIDTLNQNPAVKQISSRVKVTAMAATSRGNTALTLQGVDIEDEKNIRNIHEKIVKNGGTYLGTKMRNPIVISDKTAEQLRIKSYSITPETIDSLKTLGIPESVIKKTGALKNKRFKTEKLYKKALEKQFTKKEINEHGHHLLNAAKHYRLRNKIVFTFNERDGGLVYQTYRVCGIYKTNNTMFDQMNAFVLHDDLAQVADFEENEYHEIAILLNDNENPDEVKTNLKTTFPELSFLSWKDLSPETALMTDFMDVWYIIIIGIILMALAFGIINTMLMAILERTKELGMLMAIGMNRKRVFNMIMLETVFLTFVGAFAGMILGALSIFITGKTGLNFSSVGEGFEAVGWSAVVYPEIGFRFFILVTIMVVITGILSSIIPARKALKMNPVEAIRTE
jgi:ABC-type lipoprotein release transport system permease subunit